MNILKNQVNIFRDIVNIEIVPSTPQSEGTTLQKGFLFSILNKLSNYLSF
jgi:hypothetical protein